MRLSLRKLASCGVLLIVLLVTPSAGQTAESRSAGGDAGKSNVLITVRLVRIEAGRDVPTKSYTLVVADGTTGSKLLSGQRVPFPAGGAGDEAATEGEAIRSFVYQNIGFVVEAGAWIVDEETIKLVADLEDSRIHENEDGKPPIVETRQLAINALMKNGVPLELTRVEGASDDSGFVEVEARILQ